MDLSEKMLGHGISHPDLTRFIVILSFIVSVTIVTILATGGPAAQIMPQLYFFPVLYACYHYPHRGLWIAGICAVSYELVAIAFTYPAAMMSAVAIIQSVLFICVGAVVAHISGENERLRKRDDAGNELRRGVISTVAHELRTPLQPIMGYLNLLLEDTGGFGIAGETKTILNRCLKCVERERQIINQMLEFSVLESGKIRLDYSVFSVPELVTSIISTGGYASQAEITIDLPQNLTFDADAVKIGTVIDSMLTNAVAYSNPPRRIGIAYVSKDNDRCDRLAISDNGVGIAGEQLDAIFEPFQLADSGMLSRKYERIGLSLAIARKFIRLHGGTITVESTVNKGTTFTIHIPKVRVQEGSLHET
ncbi:MAG: sensory histidine kinase AtoS [Methanoregula sp. PtaU1.Bin051]|nr:MAG: sensory histidine kinase AtoS [Methanoregula sp. PtaU1.Bin051]